MQVNIEIASDVNTTTETNFFGKMKAALAAKVASIFVKPKKEKPKFEYANIKEAIEYIEWRTQYDQYRIRNAVKTLAAYQSDSALCNFLGLVPRSYMSEHFGFDLSKANPVTVEKLKVTEEPGTKITITDNSFEKRLVKFFGTLRPETVAAIAKTEAVITTSIEVIVEQPIIQVETVESQSDEESTLKATKEMIEDAMASLEQTEVLDEPQKTTEQSVTKRKSFSKKMTIKELKAYATEHGIHVPGRKTKHRDIFEHIKAQRSA